MHQQTCVCEYCEDVLLAASVIVWCCEAVLDCEVMLRTASYSEGLGSNRGWVIGTSGSRNHMSPTPLHLVLAVGGANSKNKNYY